MNVFMIFDGREEARIPAVEPGIPLEYAVWIGKKCGYTISHFEGSGIAMQLVMKLTDAYTDPVTAFPDHSLGGPFYGHLPKPSPVEYEEIRAKLRRARKPTAWRLMNGLLLGFGGAAAYQAAKNYLIGEAVAVWICLSGVFLTGGLCSAHFLRRYYRKKIRNL